MKTNCIKCDVKLVVGENMTPSQIKSGNYRCTPCQSSYQLKLYNKRREEDPVFKLKKTFISRIHKTTFKNKGKWKKNNTLKYTLGVDTRDEWLEYIENQFVDGMCWENYGEWELDHIIELHTVNTIEEVYKLFHHTNYQPLWKRDNIDKHMKNRVRVDDLLTPQELEEKKQRKREYHKESWKKWITKYPNYNRDKRSNKPTS